MQGPHLFRGCLCVVSCEYFYYVGKEAAWKNSIHIQLFAPKFSHGFQHLPHKTSAQRHHKMAKLFDFIILLPSMIKLVDLEQANLALFPVV